MKCRVCDKELTDEKGYCHGVEMDDDVFVCDTTDCFKFAIAVVEAARAVVAQFNHDDEDLLAMSKSVYALEEALEK